MIGGDDRAGAQALPEIRTEIMPEIRIDDQLNRLLSNPTMLETFIDLIEKDGSPSDISKRLKMKFPKANYSVEKLEDMGLIEEVRTEKRRGQDAHIYRAVIRPIWKVEEWEELPQHERERLVVWVFQLFLRDVVLAWAAGILQARVDTHTSRSLLKVDEQGWCKVKEILDDALAAVQEVEVESADRLREAGDAGELILARAAMFLIEMPRSKPSG